MPLPDRARRGRGPLFLVLLAAVALLIPAGTLAARAIPGRTVDLQILDISDWHGQIDPVSVSGVGNVGGAAYLKTYLDAARADYVNNLTLTGGDDVGATPPLSTYFDDVPAILAERMMGIQVGGVGNHNFDSGLGRFQDQIDLAGSTDPSIPGSPFRYVSSNLSDRDANIDGVSDYLIFEYKGVNVAVIGVTNEEAASLNFPGSMGTMTVTDSMTAAMAAKAAAAAEGANVFVAITHKGVTSFSAGQPQGELIDFANGVSGFHLIVGDHTDIQWSGTINGQFVFENRSKGVSFSKTVLTLRRGTGEIINLAHTFVTPVATVTPDPGIVAMLDPYRTALAPILNQLVGYSNVFIPRADSCGQSAGRTCESLVGNVIADAMRITYEADFALMNSGGIRADLTCPVIDNGSDFCPSYTGTPYPITKGSVLGVLPFGNVGFVVDLNGAELKGMLENSVSAMPATNGKFGQVSGLCFTYDIEAAVGSRVVSAVAQAPDGTCTGGAVDLTVASTYTIAINDFIAAGGDGYPVYTSRGATRGVLDQDVAGWISSNGPIGPTLQGRIICYDANPGVGSNCPVTLG